MCIFVGCRGLLVLSFAVACCWTAEGLPTDFSSASSASFSSSSDYVIDSLPCLQHGKITLHGESFQMTDCSGCVCDNSTLTCQFETCPPLPCRYRIKLEGECCKVCPYNITVNEVVPLVSPHTSLEQGKADHIAMGLEVKYSKATRTSGQGLWTLRLWMSRNEDGTDEISGTVMDEALSEGQQSQSLRRSPRGTLVFEDVRYSFDLTGHACKDAKFICAKFNKGRYPEVEGHHHIPFNFSARPSEDILTGCVENHYCEVVDMPPSDLPCVHNGQIVLHGEREELTDCLFCVCDNSTLSCMRESCPPLRCSSSQRIKVEGECCKICPNTTTTPVPDEDVDGDDGRNEIPPSTDSSLQSLLLSILETERAQLQVGQERLKLERAHLAETRNINRQIADLVSIMDQATTVSDEKQYQMLNLPALQRK